jgi:1,4-alpha-glucan branching enzyme
MNTQPFLRSTLALVLATSACAVDGTEATDDGADGKADGGSSARLGANPTSSGTEFRVWAPNADRVFVTGTFNNWNDTANELVRGTGGVFTGRVPEAHPGDEYVYVIERAGQRVKRADPRAAQMTNSAGHSVIYDQRAYAWKTHDYRTPTFDEAVVYEMHIGTFNDQPGGAPGTWTTAIAKLDHLKDLGVNMLEVLPPAEFSGDYSWGYNTAFPFAPESAYGTPDDMKHFIDEAHARGMGVMIDVVHNHWGPSDLSMWCFDIECYGKGGIYFYSDDRAESGWGPRPDFGRSEVRDYIVDNTKLWLDDYRADGLRWDSTINIRTAAGRDNGDGWQTLQRANDWVNHNASWKLMIAEDLQNNEWLDKGTGAGGAGFDTQWDAGFFHPVDRNLIEQSDANRNMNEIKAAIENRYAGRALGRVIYTESHDEVANGKQRIPEMIWPGHANSYYSKKRSTLGAALVMTAPGIPMLFQGQELLEDGYFTDQDPIDWTKKSTNAGIVAMYKDLIALRKNAASNTRGLRGEHVNVFHVNDSNKVIAFHRWSNGGAGDDVIVMLNFSNQAFTAYDLGMPRGGQWKVRFNSDWKGYDTGFAGTPSNDTTAVAGARDGLGYHATIGIGAYSAVILSQ